ncbi:Cof-type HAD-IIB family hydrolase [Microbacterium sp. W1N]|uniref:Cof-type HAD-IIB family hydrolase n=1 Tax=Microbacterium festucae TaxID=2977531 RepID=UPI0021BEEC06|nr:Cof-type HAD-IIB family hydrolase [Microbacterium festucae]MCT9819705.1 Cof-type HAD-IIB family hydrolase [Microbacterium festucae]
MSTTSTPFRRRAVFLDVDGTLMQGGHYIPPSAIAAVRAARAAGHLVLLSTGRGMAELVGEIMDIGFDGAVTNGGAYANLGDELVVSRTLTPEAVARLEERLADHGVHWYFQSYDRMFASPDLPGLMTRALELDRAAHDERARQAGRHPDDIVFFSVGMKVFDDRAHYSPHEMAKAVIVSDDADAVAAALAELGDDFAVVSGTIPMPFGHSGEIAPLGVNKGAAILELLAVAGIDPADAIGIGDNWNDAEMFEVCGLSIAMGNSVDGVKALADEVTAAIDADGIHEAFGRHGLI